MTIKTLIATTSLAIAATGALAAPVLQVGDDGKLLGARAVSVLGSLYDVQFVDGTVGSLDLLGSSNPFFEAPGAAEAAAVALREVANTGHFGIHPTAINGCSHAEVCSIVTAVEAFTLWYQGYPRAAFRGFEMANWAGEDLDWRDGDVNPWSDLASFDSTTQDGGANVFAVWSRTSAVEIPEPPIGVLMVATGLIAGSLTRRKA